MTFTSSNLVSNPSNSQTSPHRFEKLDITPKSAQKIKPVLEQWMKEAKGR
jgi:class 6 POU domain transcription factor